MMTAVELVTFARALINGGVGVNGTRILSQASAAMMATETTGFLSPHTWRVGLGWMMFPGGNVLFHGGGGPGVSSVLYAQPATGRVFALLTNCSKYGAFDGTVVEPILESWGVTSEPLSPIGGPFPFQSYEGTYESQLIRFEVYRNGEQLMASMMPKQDLYETDNAQGTTFELERVGDHLFSLSQDGVLHPFPVAFFDPDASGTMQRLASMVRIFNRVS